ncbi:MAG: SprT-like domain-containing protein [Bacteroidota bacterium]
MTGRELAQHLRRYLPTNTEETVAGWIIEHRVHFRITMPRTSRYGDYMSPHKGKSHTITVNGDLNRYSFFITVVHEFAHLQTFLKYGNYVKSHGEEWKKEFKILMGPFLNEFIFPRDLLDALSSHMADPNASSCYDHHLTRHLKKHDAEPAVFLEDIPDNGEFLLNGVKYIKGVKLRTRYQCRQAGTSRVFLIGKTAEVQSVN